MAAIPKTFTEAKRRLYESSNAFIEDDCLDLGASVAYFSVFSLAPLLLIVVAAASLFYSSGAVQQRLHSQLQSMLGSGAADQVEQMLRSQTEARSTGILMTVVGIVVLLAGATGCFAALQNALNRVWHVKPDPRVGSVRAFVVKRLWSFGMILAVVFLMIISLVVSAILAALGDWAREYLPDGLSTTLLQLAGLAASLAVLSVLFAAMFRVLPDAKIAAGDALFGGFATSVLFTIGQVALGRYLGRSAVSSIYGAAGSFVLVVSWLYYAALIVLFGAELTRASATAQGRCPAPGEGAVKAEEPTQTA